MRNIPVIAGAMLGLSLSSTVFAQTTTPPAPAPAPSTAPMATPVMHHHRHHHRHHHHYAHRTSARPAEQTGVSVDPNAAAGAGHQAGSSGSK